MSHTEFSAAMLAEMPGLQRYARRLCRSRNRAEDLLHDTVVKAMQHCDQFDQEAPMGPWMRTIMRNAFLHEIGRKRQRDVPLDDRTGETVCAADNPEQEVVQRDLHERLESVLAILPMNFRMAVMLVLVGGFSHREAADILEVPLGTILSRVARARIRLAGLLGDIGIDRTEMER